jgi:lipopolysaccharide transport system ATP-binding protein
MSDIAIKVENVSKLYRIGSLSGYSSLRESIMNAVTTPFRRHLKEKVGVTASTEKRNQLWALKDVSLEIKRGQSVGIIGRNGSGKSTLLKILARVTYPSTGRVEIAGRVASLLEVGIGFHPELTGRENIKLNAAIMGMTRSEVTQNFDDILDYAGESVKQFIDVPVKRYSSGMYVRLAFSIAAHLNTDVLLVDEVLAVGDYEFQKKCLNTMSDIAKSGRTVIFVSHSMSAVNTLCDRVIFIEAGQIETDSAPQKAISKYTETMNEGKNKWLLPVSERIDRKGDGCIKFTSLHWENTTGSTVTTLSNGNDYNLVLNYECPDGLNKKNVFVSYLIKDSLGTPLFVFQSDFKNQNFPEIPPKGRFICHVPRLPLVAGEYGLNIFTSIDGQTCDSLDDAAKVNVIDGIFYQTGHTGRPGISKVLVEGDWELKP